MAPSRIQQLLPDVPLPPYSHVPGRTPHPISNPAGHSHGVRPHSVVAPNPEHWTECREYLRGIDLFNHGYYWEAHEEWESLWHAYGRIGVTADFLKGLIKLAAAGVKVREGKPDGVRTHAQRATELFRGLNCPGRFLGLNVSELIAWAEEITANPPISKNPEDPVEIVFVRVLWPEILCKEQSEPGA
jgi:hypothetical protein